MASLRRAGLVVSLSVAALSGATLAVVPPERPKKAELLREPPAVTERAERLDPHGGPAPRAAAVQGVAAHGRDFLARRGGQWSFQVDRRTGRPDLVQGSGIPLLPGRGNELGVEVLRALGVEHPRELDPLALEPLARAFVEENAELLKPRLGRLVLDERSSLVREDGRLVSLYFRWEVDGVPVEGAHAFLRMNSGNVTQFGAPKIADEAAIETRPVVEAEEARDLLVAYTGDTDFARFDGEPELLLQPEDDGEERLAYRLVWRIVYRLPDEIETWEGRIDARTGEVVGFRDLNHYLRAVGGVYPRTVHHQNETLAPMSHARVTVGASSVTADSSGAFAFPGGSVSSGLNGHWFDTSCQGCSNPAQPIVQSSLGIGYVDFGFGGDDELGNGASTPADRNTFYHLNKVRRIAQKWLPAEPYIARTNYTSNVNINNLCNAVYNGNVNFYRAGGDCNNTGEIADVIYHEWGHGLDLETLGGDGGTGEGTADVVSMQVTHSALVGPGFRVDGSPVRNVDRQTSSLGTLTLSNLSSVCGGAVHCVGQIIGQTAWDLSRALVSKYGHHTGWRVSERLFFTSLPDQGSYNPSSSSPIYSAYLNADDNDGNLANGTPNAAEIFWAFNLHGIAVNPQSPPASSTPCTPPLQPQVAVVPQCDRFDLSWNAVAGATSYQVFRTELLSDTAMFPVATVPAGTTIYSDTEVMPGIDYWYVVMAVNASGCESRIEAPVATKLVAQPILSVAAVAADDLPRGNRSGWPDPGEEVDLRITLTNLGEEDADTVSGTIVSTTPGVTVLQGSATWSDIPSGGSGTGQGILRFSTLPSLACGSVLQFRLVPAESSGCAADASFFSVRLGQPDGQGGYVCDNTPACFVPPQFAGLSAAAPGDSCAEIDLSWQPGQSQCVNATLTYNVYRSTTAGFVPGPESLVAQGLGATSVTDALLDPAATYHYVVRAHDSRSGEDANTLRRTVVSPASPDLAPPVFGGLASATTGGSCGETVLGWSPALETCHAPVSYEIYRSTDPGFVPGPSTLVGSTLSTSFVDAALDPGVGYTYVVRSRDGAGNEDGSTVRRTVQAGQTDLVALDEPFDPTAGGWAVVAPNDATTGNWAWGDPEPTTYQPNDDASLDGTRCWFTGLLAGSGGGSHDVDEGTTTLLSKGFTTAGFVNPAVRYARWFTNDRGGSPGNDPFLVEISNDDGLTWATLETVNTGTPLAWVPVELLIAPVVTPTSQMRVRFTAKDLGAGSLVEAGIDEFQVVDLGQGCSVCASQPQPVETIVVSRSGDDVVLDWSGDPAPGTRFSVYKVGGAGFAQAVRIGSTDGRSFVHEGAALTGESYFYRVSTIDDCGNESTLD